MTSTAGSSAAGPSTAGSLDSRKAAILRAVVREYIETAQPVASAHVARLGNLAVSPATVRNEMAVLEREGFLVHPHTSAGRVPTDKGYRFYVDQLGTPPGPLAPTEKRHVEDFFARAHGELEQMLDDTGRLLTDLTDCAAVVLASGSDAATVRSVQVVALGPRVVLVVAVLSDGSVEKEALELDLDAGDARLAAASAHLAAAMWDRTLAEAPPPATTGDHATDRVVTRAHAALVGADRGGPEHVFVGGASRMAATFEAIETVRQVLVMLEQQYVVVSLLQDALRHDKLVSIGAEHGVRPLAGCSVVVAPYAVAGVPVGTIGVLGPTRMDYDRAMAAVAAVSERLGHRLQAG
ncbi:MAG: heat-inducible transcriptional repressor HrcA [Acidimicrobiales bacterium]